VITDFRSFWVLSSLLFSACAAGLPAPNAAQLDAARSKEPSVAMADLERGRSLYVGKCAGCHALKEPADLAPDAWAGAVEEMRTKQGVRLSDAEARDITRYLESASAVTRR
jgi:mono/diheme cytochrome c family protein